jgi:CheY-like chemotaxis protein
MKKVLVVDDQAGWRKFNSETIFTILGNNIILDTASSGEEGLRKYMESSNDPYDYLLTDMQMESNYYPLMAGEWLIEQVQSLNYSYKTKIIIISAAPMIKYIAGKYNVDYISKQNATISIKPYSELIKL